MEDGMPQDEYFEWEDIVLYRTPVEFTKDGEKDRNTFDYQRSFTHTFEDECEAGDFQWSDRSTNSSETSSPPSFSLKSLCTSPTEEETIDFPSYDEIDVGIGGPEKTTPIVDDFSSPEPTATQTFDDSAIISGNSCTRESRDCTFVGVQPFRNVNYLLHEWREEDVSGSWKHLVSKRKTWSDLSKLDLSSRRRHNNVVRLENASWRTWSKLRFGLRTVDPQTINWMKHQDDTCLYGPFHVALNAFTPPSTPSRAQRTPASKSKSRSPKSILKQPSTAEILRRGSLPFFSVATNTRANRITQPILQGRPLADSSPLTQSQISHQHLEFSTPICTAGPRQSRRTVKWLEEVKQCTIVNPVGDRKIHRTIKKTRSTILNGVAEAIEPAPTCTPVPALSHWSPASLWSYNSDAQKKAAEQADEQPDWTWSGVVGEDEDESDYFTSKPTTTPVETPALTSTATSPIPIGKGSLSSFYSHSMHVENQIEVEDEIDYILSPCEELSTGSYSPESLSSTSSLYASSSEESSDDELPLVRSAHLKATNMGEDMMKTRPNLGIGIMDDEKRVLYEQVMEEFNLVLES